MKIMNFRKESHLTYLILCFIVFTIYIFLKELSVNFIWTSVAVTIGSIMGYLILNVIRISLQSKIILLVASLLSFVVITYFITTPTHPRFQLIGSWEADEDDDNSISLRFVLDSVYVSRYPEYQETGYKFAEREDSLIIGIDSVVEFKWRISERTNKSFKAEDEKRVLIFFKEREIR